MSQAAIGALVQFCGHDGYFLADIFEIDGVNVIHAAADRVDPGMLTRPADGATHHLLDFPRGGFWQPRKGVFVVPANQVRELEKP